MVALTNTYWNSNGKHEALAQQLQALIPAEGQVAHPRKNKKLEIGRAHV